MVTLSLIGEEFINHCEGQNSSQNSIFIAYIRQKKIIRR